MLWRVVFSFLSCGVASPAFGQIGSRDPEFAKVPFEEWFAKAPGGQQWVKWSVRVAPPRLSSHQRLIEQIEVLLDGAELSKRVGRGELMVLVQVEDADVRPYQNHVTLDLKKMNESLKAQSLSCVMSFFVLPGNYVVRTAVYDTKTGDHSVREEKMHVGPLRNDPLDDLWRDLPPVEFIDPADAPDSWYLPSSTGRLHLPGVAQRPVHIDVLVNLTPSDRLSASGRVQNRNLGSLLPSLKTISQIRIANASMNIELLDIARRRVPFHQEAVKTLDWPVMRESLGETKPGVIDVKSLEHRKETADFFVKEVTRVMERPAPEPARVVIILSPPVEFAEGQEVQPVSIAPSPDRRIFYIRSRIMPRRLLPPPMAPPVGRGPGGRGRGGVTSGDEGPQPRPNLIDELEPTIKGLAPRLFDVHSPEDFRKALATILKEIARM